MRSVLEKHEGTSGGRSYWQNTFEASQGVLDSAAACGAIHVPSGGPLDSGGTTAPVGLRVAPGTGSGRVSGIDGAMLDDEDSEDREDSEDAPSFAPAGSTEGREDGEDGEDAEDAEDSGDEEETEDSEEDSDEIEDAEDAEDEVDEEESED